MDKIIISGIRLSAFIGVYDYEKNQKQALELDVCLFTNITNASNSDHINHTLDYEKITYQIIEWVNQTNFHLIEKLADDIAQKLLNTFPLKKVELYLKKFPKDLPAQHVGIKINRCRADDFLTMQQPSSINR